MEWFYWMLFGIVIGVGAMIVIQELQKRDFRLRWYEWILALLALLFFIGAVQNFVGSLAEGAVTAAWLMLVTLLVPSAIFGALAARRLRTHRR